MPEVIMVHVNRSERPDSIEIGSPSKGGTLKIYFDSGDPEDAERRVENAVHIRAYARTLLDAQGAP